MESLSEYNQSHGKSSLKTRMSPKTHTWQDFTSFPRLKGNGSFNLFLVRGLKSGLIEIFTFWSVTQNNVMQVTHNTWLKFREGSQSFVFHTENTEKVQSNNIYYYSCVTNTYLTRSRTQDVSPTFCCQTLCPHPTRPTHHKLCAVNTCLPSCTPTNHCHRT